jgi:hypothetical protein
MGYPSTHVELWLFGIPINCRAHSAIESTDMGPYLQSYWIRVGIGLIVIGSAPLLLIILAAAIGLWPDPNPNPVGPGVLFFLTFWPAVLCIIVGIVRVRMRREY